MLKYTFNYNAPRFVPTRVSKYTFKLGAPRFVPTKKLAQIPPPPLPPGLDGKPMKSLPSYAIYPRDPMKSIQEHIKSNVRIVKVKWIFIAQPRRWLKTRPVLMRDEKTGMYETVYKVEKF